MNESLRDEKVNTTRSTYLHQLISDNDMQFSALGPTFIHPNGKEQIMETKHRDTKMFHRLIREQRGAKSGNIIELTVDDRTYKGADVIKGWMEHFQTLSNPSEQLTAAHNYDDAHKLHVDADLDIIRDICTESQDVPYVVSTDEISEEMKKLNTGKAPDAYGITAEHIIYAGHSVLGILCAIFNAIFELQTVPDVLKLGTLSPVFKKKGQKSISKNYRGITVLPVIGKLLELIVRNILRSILDPQQNPMQRGFTAGSSPLNCALLIEEYVRECMDNNCQSFVALLDAKSAFDVVRHHNLFRKLYLSGVEGRLWNVIYSLHNNIVSAIKWEGQMSTPFKVTQGVRQGGILSADLYKVYVNDLLDRMLHSNIGGHIGNIPCNAPTCADDMSSLSDNISELQVLCNMAHDYSKKEHYQLQATKSVVLPVNSKPRRQKSTLDEPYSCKLGDTDMPVVNEAIHVGVKRSSKPTSTAAVEENISKARKTLYGLMASSLHGNNGLDPSTCIHLLKIYVIPVLLYALEILLPTEKDCQLLESMLKQTLKHILSIPVTTADPAPYILSGFIPAEGMIHIRALTFYGNICRLSDDNIEKKIAKRQLYTIRVIAGSFRSVISSSSMTYLVLKMF